MFNFSEGFSSTFLDKIIQQNDLHDARERIQKRKNYGSRIKDRIEKTPKLTAGDLVKAGTNRLGKEICQLKIERREEKGRIEKQKRDSIREEWQKVLGSYNDFKNEGKS